MGAHRWFGVPALGVLLLGTLAGTPALGEPPGQPPAPASEEHPTSRSAERAPMGAATESRDVVDERSQAWDRANRPPRTLRHGTPRQAGLVAEHLTAVTEEIEAGAEPGTTRPSFPGAVVLVARDGVIAEHAAHGDALRYLDDGPTELPEEQRLAMETDTIFDLASISKLFTAVAVMQLVERGDLDLDAPVADTIPAFAAHGKDDITIRHLLTHTAGLPAWLPLWSAYDTPAQRLAAIHDIEPTAAPGESYVYSDLGLIVLGEVVEAVTGQGLDEVVAERITDPLGMHDTGYNPDAGLTTRIAATEYQPLADRGMVHGEVHDENAWSLGGVAGHAGVFSTAEDLAVLAQTFLNGGRYGTARILEPESISAMMQNETPDFPGNERGLGFELAQHWYMDAMTTPATAGHTGFTGTSLVIDPTTDSFAILLTNRVHPDRTGPNVNPHRGGVARAAGRAAPVSPATGSRAWFSGLGDGLDHHLEVDLDLPPGPKELSLALWYDTEAPGDVATVEVSTDDGDSWTPLAGELAARHAGSRDTDGAVSGWAERRWWDATFDLDAHEGPATLRVRYETDGAYSGRGVYVDDVRVHGTRGPLFNDNRPADRDRWQAEGWHRSAD